LLFHPLSIFRSGTLRSLLSSSVRTRTRTTRHYTTTLHYTTLHYTTLHYTTLHYTTLHYATLQLHCTLHITILHALHSQQLQPSIDPNPLRPSQLEQRQTGAIMPRTVWKLPSPSPDRGRPLIPREGSPQSEAERPPGWTAERNIENRVLTSAIVQSCTVTVQPLAFPLIAASCTRPLLFPLP